MKWKIRIEFKGPLANQGIHLEIRQSNSQIRFYEVNTVTGKEYCLKKETVKQLVGRSIPRKKVVLQALKGDRQIFN